MIYERTIMHVLTEEKWKLSRLYEIYNFREKHFDSPKLVEECDREMEALHELREEIRIK